MKKNFILLWVACISVMLVVSLATCASTSASGTVIQSGAGEDPFVATAWESKGITVLEFLTDGKVEYGYTKLAYRVTQDGNRYVASFRGAGVSMSLTIDAGSATEGVFTAGGKKMPCKRIEKK